MKFVLSLFQEMLRGFCGQWLLCYFGCNTVLVQKKTNYQKSNFQFEVWEQVYNKEQHTQLLPFFLFP